jgi:hypothetical protein
MVARAVATPWLDAPRGVGTRGDSLFYETEDPMKRKNLDPRYEAIRIEVVTRNAAAAEPRPVCVDCTWPIDPGDEEWLYTSRCCTCACRHLDRILWKAARRIGRRRLRKLLKSLAK